MYVSLYRQLTYREDMMTRASPPKIYRFLEQEAQLAQCLLTNGLQEISQAELTDYEKGKFYGGAFQISIGLERLMKLAVILNHMLKHNYAPPTIKELKGYGHKLVQLYEHIKTLHNTKSDDKFNNGQLEFDTIKILSDFAVSSRYYNLDRLEDSIDLLTPRGPFVDLDRNDPLTRIILNIMSLYESQSKRYIREKRLYKAFNKYPASEIGNYHRSPLSGGLEMLVDIVQTLNYVHHGKGYFNYTVIRHIRFICSVLEDLVDKCHNYEEANGMTQTIVVPYLHHLFPIRYTTKSSALKRKNWT